MLYLGPRSLYLVDECILMEHYTIERYVTLMSKSTSWGGVIELTCLVHIYPVDIYVFQPHIDSRWMMPGRIRVNDFYLL